MIEENEPPDLRGPAIIAIGDVLGGYEFYGPFVSIDAAVQITKRMAVVPSMTIALLVDPEKLPFLKPSDEPGERG